MKQIIVAADLGGTNLRIAAVNSQGEILRRLKFPTPRSKRPNDLIEAIAAAYNQCKTDLSDYEVESFAVAIPGIIDVKTGLIFKSPNLPELNDFQMRRALKKKLVTNVLLENDANAAAFGENWLGASKDVESSIMVTLGTGVGGGIIIDGKILQGIDGTAGEIGHINVNTSGHICGCGSFGCVEQYASANAVVRIAGELAVNNPNSKLNDKKELTSEDVYQFAKAGDESAIEVFRQQGFYLGISLSGLINTLNPEVITIGGGASAAWDLFFPSLTEQISLRSYKEPAERVKVVRAELGDDAGILGVAKLGFDKM